MSLVSYGASSSEESEGEEETTQPKLQPTKKLSSEPQPTGQKKSLFSSLPPPKGLSSKLPSPIKARPKSNTDDTKLQGDSGTKKSGSLFSSLPPPKSSSSGSSQRKGESSRTREDKSKATGVGVSGLNLPPPKKKAPVKISLPSVPDPDSDEDEEPVAKKPKQSKGVAGLFASLPKPKHASIKEANRILIPHTLTKRKTVVKPTKPAAKPVSNKPASIASLVTSYDDDEDDDETDNTSSFFSLDKHDSVKPSVPEIKQRKVLVSSAKVTETKSMQGSRTSQKTVTANIAQSKSVETQKTSKIVASVEPPSQQKHLESSTGDTTESESNTKVDNTSLTFNAPTQDAPLDFKPGASTVPVYGGVASGDSDAPLSFRSGSQQQYGYYQQEAGGSGYTGASAQYSGDYSYPYGSYNQPYTGESDLQGTQEQPAQASQQQDSYLQDKEFQKMMGKHSRGKEAIDIIDVKADEYLGPNPGTEWMLKTMTEEKEHRGNLKKEQLPSSQQRRKHQITYLAHQAKEHELQLKNQWANNRMTRKQTQAKYGF